MLKTQLGMSQRSYTHTRMPIIWHRSRRGQFSGSLDTAKLHNVFPIPLTPTGYISMTRQKFSTHKSTWWASSMTPVAAPTCSWPPTYMNQNTISTSPPTMPNYGTTS